MGGGRSRRRRQASKDYDEETTRWANAIEIELSSPLVPQHNAESSTRPLDSARTKENTPLLQVAGFESQTRTIFARIQSCQTTKEEEGDCNKKRWRVEDLVSLIAEEIQKRTNDTTTSTKVHAKNDDSLIEPSSSLSCLLELGSVWILDPASADRPQNKPSWKRLLKQSLIEDSVNAIANNQKETTLCWVDDTMTLRVHSRPSRYPMAQKFRMALEKQQPEQEKATLGNSSNNQQRTGSHGGIVYEEYILNNGAEQPLPPHLAFAVLHKPLGMPSHSTVDNATENLLYQYQIHRNSAYATLPQRLDTETEGLILVAMHPSWATYFSKLLETKSKMTNHTNDTSNSSSTPSVALSPYKPSIQKKYRCLVAIPRQSFADFQSTIKTKYVQSKTIVEHYVDANSKAPKTFVDACAFPTTRDAVFTKAATKNSSNEKPPSVVHKWQLCQLRILSMTEPIIVDESSRKRKDDVCCCELEIELLTGRTHQIRGQLAALGCPIVGDPLYGRTDDDSRTAQHSEPRNWQRDRSAIRMALQCCELSFPVPLSIDLPQTIKRKARRCPRKHQQQLESTIAKDDNASIAESRGGSHQLKFRLDSAWWRKDEI